MDYSNIELVNTEVTEETCEYFTGVADLEYEEALPEPAINPEHTHWYLSECLKVLT